MNLLERLAEPFPVSQIHWRIGARTEDRSRGIALAYIDARDVMKRLDDVCGTDWQCRYPHITKELVVCEIGLLVPAQTVGVDDRQMEWVWRANGAGETNVEGEKGAMSDAFKRAAVLWGVARYLYHLPTSWVPLSDDGKKIESIPDMPVWGTPSGYRDLLAKRSGEKPERDVEAA
jgi:hypothetical protein